VIGKQFSEILLRQVLASVAPIDDVALDQALAALVVAEFLYEASVYPQVEYSFKHPLTQEVAQRSQLQARRIRVHAAVAQAMEDEGDNLDERAAEIAQHWAEAEERGRAAQWHRRAALWAGLSDPREVLRNWRRVRELAAGLSDEQERTALSLEACQQLMGFGWRIGSSDEEIASVFADGRALTRQLGDRRAEAMLVGGYSALRGFSGGSAADYVRYSEEAASIAADIDDRAFRAAIVSLPMFAYQFTGEGWKMLGWMERVLAETGSDIQLGKDVLGYSPFAGTYMIRVLANLSLGRLDEALAAAKVGEELVSAAGEWEPLAWVTFAGSWACYAAGIPGRGVELARRCLAVAEKFHFEITVVLAHCLLGMGCLTDGQPAAARESLLKSAAIVRENRTNVVVLPLILSALAEAQLALGALAEGLASAREAIEHASAGGCIYLEAGAQLALAKVLLAADGSLPRAEIEAALDRAQELVDAIEGRSLSPRVLELRGRLAAALGDAAASERALREALDLYREIGATGHAKRLALETQPTSSQREQP